MKVRKFAARPNGQSELGNRRVLRIAHEEIVVHEQNNRWEREATRDAHSDRTKKTLVRIDEQGASNCWQHFHQKSLLDRTDATAFQPTMPQLSLTCRFRRRELCAYNKMLSTL
jgi:hypothetical protein